MIRPTVDGIRLSACFDHAVEILPHWPENGNVAGQAGVRSRAGLDSGDEDAAIVIVAGHPGAFPFLEPPEGLFQGDSIRPAAEEHHFRSLGPGIAADRLVTGALELPQTAIARPKVARKPQGRPGLRTPF